jgi:hypothetical protein
MMFVKFAVWIMVYSNYPPPANHFYIGDVTDCKHAQKLVDEWRETYFTPKDYYGWVCLDWDEHLRLLYEGKRYKDRVKRVRE